MPIHIPFYKVSERTPIHNEEVVWLKETPLFRNMSVESIAITVKWYWNDSDGTLCEWNEGDVQEDGYALNISFNGHMVNDDYLYCPIDEYFKILGH